MTEKTTEQKLEDAQWELTRIRTMLLMHMGMLYGMISRLEKGLPFKYPETDDGLTRSLIVTVKRRAAQDPVFRKTCIEEGLGDYLKD